MNDIYNERALIKLFLKIIEKKLFGRKVQQIQIIMNRLNYLK